MKRQNIILANAKEVNTARYREYRFWSFKPLHEDLLSEVVLQGIDPIKGK